MTTRRKIWLSVAALGGLLTIALALLAIRVPFSSETLRTRLVNALANRLDSDVELGALSLRVFPSLHAEGTELVIYHRGRRDVPPLISVARFTVDASIVGLWNRKVSRVKLDGLAIQIPPDDDSDDAPDKEEPARPDGDHYSTEQQVVVEQLHADAARLVILRREPHKQPRVWELHTLRLQNVSGNTAMPFQTVLTNAVPPGQIDTEGSFGPWHRDDPGHTPLMGSFTFKDADLSVFKGIAGRLSAQGTYGGTLETIRVQGDTDTPDFAVTVSGQPVHLKAKYEAIVDATNGNTTLERVDASFLNTSLVAKGGVYDVEGVKGRQTKLDIDMTDARLEDVMRLAVKSERPPMIGGLRLQTTFDLPPGPEDVVDKLRLDGRFTIEDGRFTNQDVQRQVNELSARARGRSADKQGAVGTSGRKPVPSDFAGEFRLADGALTLRSLAFDIPGAMVQLRGTYSLRRETLAFNGNLVMDAKVSETMTGWKSFLLRAVDPIFRKNGKSVVPLKIGGTRQKPSFGLDLKRIF